MGRRPNTIQGTAVVRRNAPPDAHTAAYEVASKRLHHAATVSGVQVGQPHLETMPIDARADGNILYVLSAPILATGSGPSHDTVDQDATRRQADA